MVELDYGIELHINCTYMSISLGVFRIIVMNSVTIYFKILFDDFFVWSKIKSKFNHASKYQPNTINFLKYTLSFIISICVYFQVFREVESVLF